MKVLLIACLLFASALAQTAKKSKEIAVDAEVPAQDALDEDQKKFEEVKSAIQDQVKDIPKRLGELQNMNEKMKEDYAALDAAKKKESEDAKVATAKKVEKIGRETDSIKDQTSRDGQINGQKANKLRKAIKRAQAAKEKIEAKSAEAVEEIESSTSDKVAAAKDETKAAVDAIKKDVEGEKAELNKMDVAEVTKGEEEKELDENKKANEERLQEEKAELARTAEESDSANQEVAEKMKAEEATQIENIENLKKKLEETQASVDSYKEELDKKYEEAMQTNDNKLKEAKEEAAKQIAEKKARQEKVEKAAKDAYDAQQADNEAAIENLKQEKKDKIETAQKESAAALEKAQKESDASLEDVKKVAAETAKQLKQAQVEQAKVEAVKVEETKVDNVVKEDSAEKKRLLKKLARVKGKREKAQAEYNRVKKKLMQMYTDKLDSLQSINMPQTAEVQVASTQSSVADNKWTIALVAANIMTAIAFRSLYKEHQSLSSFKTGFLEEF